MRIYGLIYDNGDGSSSVRWFSDVDVVEEIFSERYEYAEYYANEGSPAVTLELPDNTDLYKIGIECIDGKSTVK